MWISFVRVSIVAFSIFRDAHYHFDPGTLYPSSLHGLHLTPSGFHPKAPDDFESVRTNGFPLLAWDHLTSLYSIEVRYLAPEGTGRSGQGISGTKAERLPASIADSACVFPLVAHTELAQSNLPNLL